MKNLYLILGLLIALNSCIGVERTEPKAINCVNIDITACNFYKNTLGYYTLKAPKEWSIKDSPDVLISLGKSGRSAAVGSSTNSSDLIYFLVQEEDFNKRNNKAKVKFNYRGKRAFEIDTITTSSNPYKKSSSAFIYGHVFELGMNKTLSVFAISEKSKEQNQLDYCSLAPILKTIDFIGEHEDLDPDPVTYHIHFEQGFDTELVEIKGHTELLAKDNLQKSPSDDQYQLWEVNTLDSILFISILDTTLRLPIRKDYPKIYLQKVGDLISHEYASDE